MFIIFPLLKFCNLYFDCKCMSWRSYNEVYFRHETVNLTVILNFIGVKMTMNCDYGSAVGVIRPVENRILPILHPYLN